MKCCAGVLYAMKYLLDKRRIHIIITCEHGGNKVPLRFRKLFAGREKLLNSHRGYDRYALRCAVVLAKTMNASFFYSTVTRLLIDLNRSPHHPKLFSSFSGILNADEKKLIRDKHYLPYRKRVETCVLASASKEITTLHISVHSFAAVMEGRKKNADIGLLYDPSRQKEKTFCMKWKKLITKTAPHIKVRRNYPYLGAADGLVTYLRKKFPPDLYIGIELEINQKMMKNNKKRQDLLCDTLLATLASF